LQPVVGAAGYSQIAGAPSAIHRFGGLWTPSRRGLIGAGLAVAGAGCAKLPFLPGAGLSAVATMTALAGGAAPWVDADFAHGVYFDQVNDITTVGKQWLQNTNWGGFDPAAIVPGFGLPNGPINSTGPSGAIADPTLVDAAAARLVGSAGPDTAGPAITFRLQAWGPNAQGNGWYCGRFDLPGYNTVSFATVNNTIEANLTRVNYGNGIYYNDPPGVPPNGQHFAAVIYPDQSAKVSCGGAAIVDLNPLPGQNFYPSKHAAPRTPSTNIGLALVVPSVLSPVNDYFLQRVTLWVGDLSAYLTALSA
jgi:hypothetical protein